MKKLIIFLVFALAMVILADHYGIISLPSIERPTALDNKVQIIKKSKSAIEDDSG